MKTISATIMFALVRVPVLATGVTVDREPKFKTLHGKCLTPIVLKKWCPKHNVELFEGDMVKGVKVGTNKYAPLSDQELAELKPERSNIVALTKFAPAADVHYSLYNRHYWLIPDQGPTDEYALLANALLKKKAVGVGSTALWGKEHPVLIQYQAEGLVLSLLHQYEDFQQGIDFPTPEMPKDKLLAVEMARAVDSRMGRLESEDWRSSYRVEREKLVAAMVAEAPAAGLPPVDLMTRLKLSVSGKKGVKKA